MTANAAPVPAGAKKPVNLSLDAQTVEKARSLGMNLSQTVDALLAKEVNQRYWQQWREDNREAFDAYNAQIRQRGLTLAPYRTWAKGAEADQPK
ncbi:MAG: type II toxin-antitoxin system CcdA family antitoxin [Ramlibacter sp.]|nr:type II toxin-antitoxin system CcdA family antitoxin [Ramlibacter sp.]